MDHFLVALPLPILCNPQALLVAMDEVEEVVVVEEEATMMITLPAIHRPIQALAVAHNPLPHLPLKFLLSVRPLQICLFHQRFQRDLKPKCRIQRLALSLV